jgi:hypothetical protein
VRDLLPLFVVFGAAWVIGLVLGFLIDSSAWVALSRLVAG